MTNCTLPQRPMQRQSITAFSMALLLLAGAVCLHADDVVIRPLPKPGPLDNPLKGWCPYTDAGEIRQPYSMVFLYVPWSELEPSSGDYRFDAWEKSWNVEESQVASTSSFACLR